MTADSTSRIRSLFFGDEGLRPTWRFCLFLIALLLVFYLLEDPLLLFIAKKLHLNPEQLSAPALIVEEAVDLAILLLVTGAAALLEKRRIDSYGMPVNCAFRGKFWEGFVFGLLSVAFVAGGMLLTGGMQVHGIALQGSKLVFATSLWLFTMFLVGINEEYLFRGYALDSLARGIGFWPAAIVTSGLFAGAHVSKPHENAVDIGMIFVLGLLLCFTLLRTGTLWLAVGWHAAFDFGQFFIVGTKNGGQFPVDRLLDASFRGPAWSNGGELGTEASYFMIPVVILSFIYGHWRFPAQGKRDLSTTQTT